MLVELKRIRLHPIHFKGLKRKLSPQIGIGGFRKQGRQDRLPFCSLAYLGFCVVLIESNLPLISDHPNCQAYDVHYSRDGCSLSRGTNFGDLTGEIVVF